MKIAFISEYNSLTTIGGTEYYTDVLLQGLNAEGYDVILISRGAQNQGVIHIAKGEGGKEYDIYLLPAEQYSSDEIKQKIVSRTWFDIFKILSEFNPDLIHVHTLTTFFNIRHFELFFQRFPNIIFTSHLPGHFCAKGDLIRNNILVCDGKIGVQCMVCLFSKGLKSGLSNLKSGNSNHKLAHLKILHQCNVYIICVADWQKKQLIANGYPDTKIGIIRQALSVGKKIKQESPSEGYNRKKIGYLGRLSAEKGAAFLVDIIKSFSGRIDVEFILGIPNNSDPFWVKQMERITKQDLVSVKIKNDITEMNKSDFFAEIDVLFIPSFCIETGPVVLLESVFFGRPVVAPNAGGPAEFAVEYPAYVTCYDWNSRKSAVRKLEEVMSRENRNLPDYTMNFNQKQAQFIKQHLDIYKNILNHEN